MDERKRAIMRREGCGSHNEEGISKPHIVLDTESFTQNTPFFDFVKATGVKHQESRLLHQSLTFSPKQKEGTSNFAFF